MDDSNSPGVKYGFDKLCGACTGIFNVDTPWSVDDYQPHHDIQALTRSASTGCHLCSLILAQISSDDVSRLEHDLKTCLVTSSNQLGINIRGSPTLTLWVAASNTSVARKGWDTCKDGRIGLAILHIRLQGDDYTNEQRSSARENFSESAVAQFSLWIEQCQSRHPKCRDAQMISATRHILPTRLLHLMSAPEGGQVKLCSSGTLRYGIKYATLSHCWGGVCKRVLTTKELSTFEQGIAIKSLPKTFQDAVEVTRRLGLHYLWIDALCIEQDNIDDWRKEAAMMGDIYANSHITIAATASSDSAGGHFYDRNPISVWPCRVIATWTCFPAGKLVISVPEWAAETDLEPLACRAWVVQEWLLSKRLLHFGKDQVRWQCYSLAASEVYPDGSSSGDDSDLDAFGIPTKSTILRMLQTPEQANDIWWKIREDYSKKALSRADDRLSALIGIARMVHRALKSPDNDYLAGLWKPHLLEELLWQRGSDISTTADADNSYIAPTWSWACLVAPFLQFSHKVEAGEIKWLISVVDAKVNAASDAFGSINGGFLTIKCSLSYITATSLRTRSHENSEQRWTISSINNAPVSYPCSLSLDHPPRAAPTIPSTTHFMPIRASFCQDSRQNSTAGLLLVETGNRPGQYRRIGLLNIFSGKQQHVLLSEMDKGATPDENSYLATASRADRLIEIV